MTKGPKVEVKRQNFKRWVESGVIPKGGRKMTSSPNVGGKRQNAQRWKESNKDPTDGRRTTWCPNAGGKRQERMPKAEGELQVAQRCKGSDEVPAAARRSLEPGDAHGAGTGDDRRSQEFRLSVKQERDGDRNQMVTGARW